MNLPDLEPMKASHPYVTTAQIDLLWDLVMRMLVDHLRATVPTQERAAFGLSKRASEILGQWKADAPARILRQLERQVGSIPDAAVKQEVKATAATMAEVVFQFLNQYR